MWCTVATQYGVIGVQTLTVTLHLTCLSPTEEIQGVCLDKGEQGVCLDRGEQGGCLDRGEQGVCLDRGEQGVCLDRGEQGGVS